MTNTDKLLCAALDDMEKMERAIEILVKALKRKCSCVVTICDACEAIKEADGLLS